MNNKRKPVHPTVAIRIQDSRLNTETLDNIQIIVRSQLIRCSGERGADHRLHHIHAQGSAFQPWTVVNDHGNPAGPHPVERRVSNPRSYDGLAIQLFLREMLQVSDGAYDHVGIGHGMVQ